jgi:hypothetical protein
MIETTAVWNPNPAVPVANSKVTIGLTVLDSSNKVMKDFDINHEKKVHMILISRDLNVFQHLHPMQAADGSFSAETILPQSGDYRLIADYIPKGGMQMPKMDWWDDPNVPNDPTMLTADQVYDHTVDGLRVKLTIPFAKSKENIPLTFRFSDAASGDDVTNLEPYLGAVGHVVIVNTSLSVYLHTHPLDGATTGPEATFEVTFPESGVYKLWGQFQRSGKVIVVPFVVNIP